MKKTLLTLICPVYLSAQAPAILNINNIAAMFNPNGCNFLDQTSGLPYYRVPATTNENSAFASSIWIGGFDAGNQLRMTAQTYVQSGKTDYFPGPVCAGGNYTHNASWNKVWSVYKTEIDAHIAWFQHPSSYPGYTIPYSISSWPGNGDVSYGQAAQLAPYVDRNGDGIYNPVYGDYPCIKGDQAVFYIINDDQGTHTQSGGQKLMLEIHCMGYGFISADPNIENSIFVDYKIINRSANNYHGVYVTTFDDFDLGDYSDDFIGANVGKNLYYTYNGHNTDAVYGAQVPAIGVTYLKTPLAPVADGIDNDHDGTIDEPGEMMSLTGVHYCKNNDPGIPLNMTDAVNAKQFYNYSSGLWRDSTQFTCGGNAYGGTTPTKYVYPGTSYSLTPCSNWTEVNAGNFPGDRKIFGNCGPLNFNASDTIEIEMAYVWAQVGNNNPQASVNQLFITTDSVQHLYANYISKLGCPHYVNSTSVQELKEATFNIYPNPASDMLYIDSKSPVEKIEIIDALGKSWPTPSENQGYNVGGLNPGIYIIKLTTSKGVFTKRFLKD